MVILHQNATRKNQAKCDPLCLVCLFFAILGIFKILFFPININEYENRYAEQLPRFALEGWMAGSFQDEMEAALSDQLPAAVSAKKAYNSIFTTYNTYLLRAVMNYAAQVSQEEAETTLEESEIGEDFIQTIKDPAVFYWTLPDSTRQVLAGHLMYANRFLNGEKEKLDERIWSINATVNYHPGQTFYLYYIEKETDVNFMTGETSGFFKYLRDKVSTIPDTNKSRFHVTNFNDFDTQFYRTDHHWNNKGSYLAYTQILAWLLPEEKPLPRSGNGISVPLQGQKLQTSMLLDISMNSVYMNSIILQ